MYIRLKEAFFSEKEHVFLEHGEFKLSLFIYESGIKAIKLANSRGYISVLPYNGQMIWDAVFDERSLKMYSSYDMPQPATSFRHSYGCYLMHCGATSMGNPSPEDTHAHHGELPYANYKNAVIMDGKDEKGAYIAISSSFEYNLSFGDHYVAQPEIRMYEGSAMLSTVMRIENKSSLNKMDLMYLCHVNNDVIPGAEIIQSMAWSPETMEVRSSIPEYSEADPQFMELLSSVQKNVAVTRVLREEDIYKPEIVFHLKNFCLDENKMAHFLYKHKDGKAEYTSFNGKELNHGVRWIVNHKEWRSMGMVLPATAEAEGKLAEIRKGHLRQLMPGEVFITKVFMGALNAQEAEKVEAHINDIIERNKV